MRKAVGSSDQEVPPLCSPLAQLSKVLLINSSMTSRPQIHLMVNASNLLLPLQSGTRWDSPVMRRKYKSWIQILPKLLLSPLGLLWARFPYQFLRNWNTKLGKRYPLLTLLLPLPRLHPLAMPVLRSANIAWGQLSRESNLKFRKAAKCGYEQACEYLDIWNKIILIQHRALICFSKSLAHILQRELHSMGNTGLLGREARMTLLHPPLGDTRRQELRNLPFWHSSLFKSQLVKEGEDFLLRKGTSKDSQCFRPYPTKQYGATPHKAVTNCFPQVGETKLQRLQGSFSTPQ